MQKTIMQQTIRFMPTIAIIFGKLNRYKQKQLRRDTLTRKEPKRSFMKNLHKMEKMVGKRYASLDEIKKEIEKLTGVKVAEVIRSSSDKLKGTDFMLDFEFEDDGDVYTIFYLKDNAGNYYITEI